jgi:hypothetical protein
MNYVRVGARVFNRNDPDRVGTVLRVYEYPSLTVKEWADVKWDAPVRPEQYEDTSSVPLYLLELA